MKVKDCMCDSICYCTPNTSICDCAKLMSDNHVGCIPVCNDKQEVVGLVTDRDLILRCVACDKDAKGTMVSDVMSCNVCVCDPNEEVNEVESKMSHLQIRRIPVVENNKVIGMVTIGDLASNKNVNTQSVCNTLENICKCDDKNAE